MKSIRHLALVVAGVCAVGVTAAGSAQAAGGPFHNRATGTTSRYTVVPGRYRWTKARDRAAATLAPTGCTNHLAVITSGREQAYITRTAGDLPDYWLGAERTGDNGQFTWVTGEAFNFSHWDRGQPDNFKGNEPYLEFYPHQNRWNDHHDARFGYLLETECPGPTAAAR